MSVVDSVTGLTGDGVWELSGGLANYIIIKVRDNGRSAEIFEGGEHRWNHLGWVAIGDEVSSITGGDSPEYSWHDWQWLQFNCASIRIGNLYGQTSIYPNAINYHFPFNVEADMWTFNEIS